MKFPRLAAPPRGLTSYEQARPARTAGPSAGVVPLSIQKDLRLSSSQHVRRIAQAAEPSARRVDSAYKTKSLTKQVSDLQQAN